MGGRVYLANTGIIMLIEALNFILIATATTAPYLISRLYSFHKSY